MPFHDVENSCFTNPEVSGDLINERTEEGRASAKKRGVKFGRKFKLTPHQRDQVRTMLGLTAQRYRIRRRIFDTLLKRCIFHRFGTSQFSGMILACFLGGRTPVVS